jgi:hypothetical protein
MSSYEVGQIIYLLVEKSARVFPVQVVEEIVRKSIAGEKITYMVKLPNESAELVDLDDLKAQVYINEDLLKQKMISNATSAIEKMVDKAVMIGKEIFSKTEEVEDKSLEDEDSDWENISINQNSQTKSDSRVLGRQDLSNSVQTNTKDGKIKVDLGNGVIANIDPEAADLLNR